ncbi:MAG: universal stress protein [Candidatus Obscuribacterales bacterium]|nr:universal stress protein [Candidatus Obscuribacterales bacterium]
MKILVAIDDSPYSKHVIDAVRTRHWPKDTEFRVLNVVEPVANEYEALEEYEFTTTLEEIDKRRMESAHKLCLAAAEKLRLIPSSIVHFDIRRGKPSAQILKSAIDWTASKIVIGAHGRDLCPHGFIGSVSRAVCERAGCSVEVVRAVPGQKRRKEHHAKENATV